jgi:hypothetical protein
MEIVATAINSLKLYDPQVKTSNILIYIGKSEGYANYVNTRRTQALYIATGCMLNNVHTFLSSLS